MNIQKELNQGNGFAIVDIENIKLFKKLRNLFIKKINIKNETKNINTVRKAMAKMSKTEINKSMIELLNFNNLSEMIVMSCPKLVRKLCGTDLFIQRDCSMIEINPLVMTSDDKIVALDAKVSFDDSASFRNPWIEDLRDLTEESEIELRAQNHGLSYVDLDGNIGCLVNGAGLAMATMDVIKLYGGEPANFLDIGGGADAKSISTGLEIILEDSRLDGILVNIFGGIIRCDMVAECILEVSNNIEINIPIVVRFSGTNHAQGKAILNNSGLGIITTDSLSEAGQAIVKVIGGD